LQRLIWAYTNPGDRVLSPFCGSGTVGLVCKHEGRLCVEIDISEDSALSALERIESGFYRK
jgi:site-specific DNA-methyltransferase (adenine-specific)